MRATSSSDTRRPARRRLRILIAAVGLIVMAVGTVAAPPTTEVERARLRGRAAVAADVFERPVQLTSARDVGGAMQTFENPQFSTAIGLAKYAMAVSANIPEESTFSRLTRGLGIFRRRSR